MNTFSTLYRVDAIEAVLPIPAYRPTVSFSTLYRVDAIEAMAQTQLGAWVFFAFSTLYRVDAIEAFLLEDRAGHERHFQYPLSGRCY